MAPQLFTKFYNHLWLDRVWIAGITVSQFATIGLAFMGYWRSRQNAEKLSEIQSALLDKEVIAGKVRIPLDRL